MVGMGIMQLFAGGISDSFGRRIPFLIAMALFIIATIYIPFSHTIYQLLILRAVQGVLVAVIMVSIRCIIPDLFKERELQIMTTYTVMAWSIGPIIAPVIGGYLQQYFGWKANFYFLAGYGLLAFTLVLFYLPETTPCYHHFHPATILKRYKTILSNKSFLSGIMIDGLLYSLILLFAVVGPFLIQTVLHYSAVQFGHIALLIGLAWFIGAMTSRFLVNIVLSLKSKIIFWNMLFIVIAMIAAAAFISMNIYLIMIPLILIVWLSGILFPRYAARAIALFPETSASTNALFGAFVFMISGISSALGSFLKSTSQLPLSIAYLGIIIVCLGINYRSIK
jgi:multidrug resistance protein